MPLRRFSINLCVINNTLHYRIFQYKKVGIYIEILDDSVEPWTIKITQTKLVNGFVLNQKELVTRVKDLFEEIPTKVVPVTFSLDLTSISQTWLLKKMNEFGLSRKDLIKQLGLTKEDLQNLFSKNPKISNPTKAALFYYFLNHENNRDLRKHLLDQEAREN